MSSKSYLKQIVSQVYTIYINILYNKYRISKIVSCFVETNHKWFVLWGPSFILRNLIKIYFSWCQKYIYIKPVTCYRIAIFGSWPLLKKAGLLSPFCFCGKFKQDSLSGRRKENISSWLACKPGSNLCCLSVNGVYDKSTWRIYMRRIKYQQVKPMYRESQIFDAQYSWKFPLVFFS